MTNSSLARRVTWWNLLFLTLAVSALGLTLTGSAVGLWNPARADTQAASEPSAGEVLPAAEFSQLIRDLSEEDGYFRSDNFTSNETSYLHVVSRLQELGVTGGAYVGVGPEQNFTYIAKTRPQIAFVIDIRRQAMIQHLLYKAAFHSSPDRAAFLATLLSRPLEGAGVPPKGASIDQILEYFASAPAPDEAFAANLSNVVKLIEEKFRFPLSEQDRDKLRYVYTSFRNAGLGIAFRMGQSNFGGGYGGYPNLKDLVLQEDQKGNLGNFLATEEGYRIVRELHLRNRIIPVVGDFAGPKALKSVGDYLTRQRYTVRAFYTSNVEQFLFQNNVFGAFVENVRKLPIDDTSVFIRAVPSRNQPHPAYVAGHRTTTVLQKIAVFLKDYDEGSYTDYWTMTTTHFIAGHQP